MKKYCSILVAAALLTSCAVFAQPAAKVEENINYKWSFVARVGDPSARRLVTITRDTILRTGDEFKMMVHLVKKTSVYVFYRGPAGDIDLLFPYGMESEIAPGRNYYIPKGRDWNRFDSNTGLETFYIIASADRLPDLENAWRSYLAAAPAKKLETAQLVVNGIKEVKKKYRTFQTLAERPISIAGNVRGSKSSTDPNRVDIADLATEVSASNFYSKTITIDHK
jgi:hypothetical protein